ncbi:sugar ABC transporter permease [Microbacterium sp. H1-D42]|uniref:carbohydrate ABC transporter permease n=1 Tax=Microbacterium sp. H1-D42 TaxID=2925844 RepID=UPI001F5334AE|nr:sugar ABC transporter permease [Microbacterium sp. H1-D42]UNK70482.1 sugar ABC transporter permease [Microbacterium sp. H1-D42]
MTKARLRGREAARRPASQSSRGRAWWALVFIGPAGLGLAVFYIWPIFRGLYLAFQDVGPFGGEEFVGFANFVEIFSEPDMYRALFNTLMYAAICLAGVPIAMVVAVLINTKGLKLRGLWRVLFFLPVVTMPVAVALVWRILLNVDYGIVNQTLAVFGIPGVAWLSTPVVNIIVIAFVGIWMGLGTQIIIFTAGLQGVPDTLLEAAELDGAGPVRRFTNVIVPLLSPTTFLLSVLSIIASMQVFDLIYLMIGQNNPALAQSQSLVSLFYTRGFLQNDLGAAAAIACVLLIIILALSAIQFRLQRKWVHYE